MLADFASQGTLDISSSAEACLQDRNECALRARTCQEHLDVSVNGGVHAGLAAVLRLGLATHARPVGLLCVQRLHILHLRNGRQRVPELSVHRVLRVQRLENMQVQTLEEEYRIKSSEKEHYVAHCAAVFTPQLSSTSLSPSKL